MSLCPSAPRPFDLIKALIALEYNDAGDQRLVEVVRSTFGRDSKSPNYNSKNIQGWKHTAIILDKDNKAEKGRTGDVELWLDNMDVTDAQLAAILPFFAESDRLTKVYLKNSAITHVSVAALAQVVPRCNGLKCLYIQTAKATFSRVGKAKNQLAKVCQEGKVDLRI